MKYLKLLCLASCLPFAACDNTNDVEDVQENANLIRLEVYHPHQSRVTATNFEKLDEIGLFMTSANTKLQLGGNELNNEKFTFDGKNWNSRKVYWNQGQHDVYAYYPFEKNINGIEDYTFQVALDQNTPKTATEMGGYEASDFLWASSKGLTASDGAIQLKFTHCMSKLNIQLVKGDTFEGEIPSDAEVYVHNTVPVASIDLSTGGVSKNIYAGSQSVKAKKIDDAHFTACLVPQNIRVMTPLVEVITQGVSYLMEGKISLRQGTQHTVVITLTKNPDQTKIEIGGEIVDWK